MTDFIASFIWGTLGLGIFIFGRKRREIGPFMIGLALMILSYFLTAAWLTVAGVLLLAALWLLARGGGE